MHLKKLIISGFKSFADKVTLNFNRGITGVVGPNGSGKSNIIDSVRWVMGEQNAKHLRGKIATDIIFAGSDKRKALAMAEVTLVIDNSDFSDYCPAEYRHEPEIALTRRLYIDGQREYLINKKPCRFKDIIGFFATTGLGGRSYSMIQQGQVDRILNAKAEDVREILEEAAGTTVFKVKRTAALKKLESTTTNLSRIEDLIKELEKDLEALKVQVEKAQKWKSLTDELKEKELSLFAHTFSIFNEKQRTLREQLDTDVDREVTFFKDLSVMEARKVELQNVLDDSDPELEELREKFSNIKVEIARAESTIQSARKTIENGEAKLVEIDSEVEEDSTNLKQLEATTETASEELSLAKEEVEKLQEDVESFQELYDQVAEKQQVLSTKVADQEDEVKNIDLLLQHNGIRCENVERERKRSLQDMTKFQERVSQLESELSEITGQLDIAKKEVSEKRAGVDAVFEKKNEIDQSIAKREEDIQTLAGERDQLKELYLNTNAKYSSLKELENQGSNVGEIYDSLKEDPNGRTIVRGMLTDFITFTSNSEELSKSAISAFEQWSERFILDDLEALNDLVRLIEPYDSCNIPVTVLGSDENTDNKEVINAWAYDMDAIPLREYLKVHTEISALSSLIDRLYYLPSVMLAKSEIEKVPSGLVVFTAKGIIVTDHNEFVVGTTGAKGILSRKSDLLELSDTLKKARDELAVCQNKLDQLEEQQTSEKLSIRELEEKLKGQNEETLGVLANLQSISQQEEHKRELLEDAAKEFTRCEESTYAFTKDLEELGQTRINLGQERENLLLDLEDLKQDELSVQDENDEFQRTFQQRKLDLVKKEERCKSLHDKYSSIQSHLERLQSSLSRRYGEKDRIELELEQARVNEKQCHEEIESYILRQEELNEELTVRKGQNAEIATELREIETKLKSARDKQAELERTKSKKNLELEKVKMQVEASLEQAYEKYHIDLTTYEFEKDPDFNQQERSKAVSRLRNRIEGIGAVNMIAVEEYEQKSKRYEFITAQRDEVLGSICLLEDAISEIEETAKTKFLNIFHTINKNFKELFPILFPGGEAHLCLTMPDDPLNGGVDILVRLPGKKTQSMTLFSGGEKALTAISLIFALLKTKPTPFCFLDEVDAPLDEANVGRYNKVLEVLANRFQFVVITHNRRTMEVLDQLYGVTMQEGGVSKVVGVDMQKDLPAHLKKAFKQEEKDKMPVAGASSKPRASL